MKKLLLDRFAAYFFGKKLWGQIQGVVNIVDDPNLSGAEKKRQAIEMLEKIGIGIAGFILNLALELAVTKLRMGKDG